MTELRLSPSTLVASLLLMLAFAGLLGSAVAWFLLTDRIGRAPTRPSAEHTVPYSRHGQTAYLTQRDDELLRWLPAVGFPCGVGVFAFALWVRTSYARDRK